MTSWANMLKKSIWGDSTSQTTTPGSTSNKTVQSLKENWILVKDDEENCSNIEESVDLNDFSEKDHREIMREVDSQSNLSDQEYAKKVQEVRAAWLKKRKSKMNKNGLNNSQYSNVSKKSLNFPSRKRNSPSTCSSNGHEDRSNTNNKKDRQSSPDLSDSNEVANTTHKLMKKVENINNNNASNYKMRASNKKTAKNRNKPYGKKSTSLQQPMQKGLK